MGALAAAVSGEGHSIIMLSIRHRYGIIMEA